MGRRDDAGCARSRAQQRAAEGRAKPGRRSARTRANQSRLAALGDLWPGPECLACRSRAARARRIDKPGQVFNRIHVADIAQAIEAAFARGADGVFNVTDDDPTPQGVPITFAAELLGVDAAAGNSIRGGGEEHDADGAVVLWREQARAQRQAQARAWRHAALSDLSRRACGRCSSAAARDVRDHRTNVSSRSGRTTITGRVSRRLLAPDGTDRPGARACALRARGASRRAWNSVAPASRRAGAVSTDRRHGIAVSPSFSAAAGAGVSLVAERGRPDASGAASRNAFARRHHEAHLAIGRAPARTAALDVGPGLLLAGLGSAARVTVDGCGSRHGREAGHGRRDR